VAALDFFTVTGSGVGAIGIDYVDLGTDPDESIVFAFVEFQPRLAPGTVIWASGLTPPRGIQLDKVKGRFSPSDGILRTIIAEATNEKQRVTVTADDWSVTFSGQTTTPPLDIAATAAQFDAALEALSNIGTDEVYVSGANGGPFDVTFHGTLGKTNVPQMSGTNATVQTLTEGDLDAGVKLVANTSVLDLDELIYDVVFTVPESDRILNPFAILAPTTTGVTVDLATVTKLPPREPGTFE
jgi:hypothetical protein